MTDKITNLRIRESNRNWFARLKYKFKTDSLDKIITAIRKIFIKHKLEDEIAGELK